jgi:large subunit ribosomal protein L6
MSRVGKKAIPVPEKVSVNVGDGKVTVKGPKGELTVPYGQGIGFESREGRLHAVITDGAGKGARAFWGLYRSLVANAVIGVTEGFQKRLEVEGIGYRVAVKGKTLEMNIGYSHPVVYAIPAGIEIKVEGNNRIEVGGIDKGLVGQTAAEIRALKPPEPYKGKGIRYESEVIRRKAGKTGA